MMPKADRFNVLLKLAASHIHLDVLNRYAVDDYVEATGAAVAVMPYGADKCRLMGRDLSEMAQFPNCLLMRHRASITGLAGQGFPKWVWSYRLTPKGKSALAKLARQPPKADPHANGCPDSPGICECFR